jgi:hypothetical protein
MRLSSRKAALNLERAVLIIYGPTKVVPDTKHVFCAAYYSAAYSFFASAISANPGSAFFHSVKKRS